MNTLPATIDQIETTISLVRKRLDANDARRDALFGEPANTDFFVVGFLDGKFVQPDGVAYGDVLKAKLFKGRRAADQGRAEAIKARAARGVEGVPMVMTYDHAVALVLDQAWRAHDFLCELFQQGIAARHAWEDAQRKADLPRDDDWAEDIAAYHAEMDRKADEGDYHDQWR